METLNDEQKLAVYTVLINMYERLFGTLIRHEHMTLQQLYDRISKWNTTHPSQEKLAEPLGLDRQLLMILSGTGGTGKSLVLTLIPRLVNRLFEKLNLPKQETIGAVQTAAPTGTAAIGIHGSTLHTLLGIRVSRSKYGEHSTTSHIDTRNLQALQRLQEKHQNLVLVLIDEVSIQI